MSDTECHVAVFQRPAPINSEFSTNEVKEALNWMLALNKQGRRENVEFVADLLQTISEHSVIPGDLALFHSVGRNLEERDYNRALSAWWSLKRNTNLFSTDETRSKLMQLFENHLRIFVMDFGMFVFCPSPN